MKIEESSTFTNHEQESALSSCFHEESTPHGMSGIQINVEEASNDGHKNVVRHLHQRSLINHPGSATFSLTGTVASQYKVPLTLPRKYCAERMLMDYNSIGDPPKTTKLGIVELLDL
uniref:Uncharacterized protein n=1 Tax=Vespula pensylvanica TaxID=30213 RepID=A0A834P8H6_VESPE|nr:hypothetical protein H0235_005194 [Vespula pensylvanica]